MQLFYPSMYTNPLSRALFRPFLAVATAAVVWAASNTARGNEDIFVASNNNGGPVTIFGPHTGLVGEYGSSGAPIDASFLSGLSAQPVLAVSGSDLFVAAGTTIGECTTSGATVNASLITGLGGETSIAVSGSHLFVANFATGTIGEYTTSGTPIDTSLISGLYYPTSNT